MTSDVMLAVLKEFNRKLLFEQKKIILFLDDTTCHMGINGRFVFTNKDYLSTYEHNLETPAIWF